MRLPKQVLIIPFRIVEGKAEYCLFKRKKMQIWQWIAGGVEDFDESILTAAKRETFEETGISDNCYFFELEEYTKIPVVNIAHKFKWGENVFFVEEFSFAVNCVSKEIILSNEHDEFKWTNYENARELLKYDSNKNALWELNEKIIRNIIK